MTKLSNVPMQPKPDAVERPLTLVERIQPILDDLMMECFKHGFHQKEMTEAEFIDYSRKNCVPPKLEIIGILKQHSDWIDISVEPSNRTEFDSEAVLAIDINGYAYNVTLADVVICGEKKREWTECKAKWNGEFWEAVEYICQAEKLVAYKYIPSPPSEVQDD